MKRPKETMDLANQYDLVEINELRELRAIRARALAKTPEGRPPIAGLPLKWSVLVTLAFIAIPLIIVWAL